MSFWMDLQGLVCCCLLVGLVLMCVGLYCSKRTFPTSPDEVVCWLTVPACLGLCLNSVCSEPVFPVPRVPVLSCVCSLECDADVAVGLIRSHHQMDTGDLTRC